MKDCDALGRLTSMIVVLRKFLGNRATNGEWMKQMQTYGGAGWSRASFMRRLSVLKASRWVMVVGGGIASPGTRTAQGEVYAATDLAPGAGDTATGEAGRAEVGAEENQSQQKQSQSHPFGAFGVCETAESSAAIPEPVSPVSRQSHETGAGNSADPVVPAALSGEALIAAALRQLGLKGGK